MIQKASSLIVFPDGRNMEFYVFSVLPQVSSILWRQVGNRTVTQFAPPLVFNVLEQARAFQTHLLYPYLSL